LYARDPGFTIAGPMGECGERAASATMKAYMCVICGFVYEEAKGLPEDGIAPGTLWADIPENWQCPECGAAKSDFEMVEI
jgi:rubredoxin